MGELGSGNQVQKNDGICEARNPMMMIMTETGYIGRGLRTRAVVAFIHLLVAVRAIGEDEAFVYLSTREEEPGPDLPCSSIPPRWCRLGGAGGLLTFAPPPDDDDDDDADDHGARRARRLASSPPPPRRPAARLPIRATKI